MRCGARSSVPRPSAWSAAHADLHSTFALSKWFGKPPAASPLECARHGWALDDRDRLRCPSCEARLSYRIAAKPGTEAHKASLQHFVDRLRSAHADYCGWREEACSPDYAAVCAPASCATNPE